MAAVYTAFGLAFLWILPLVPAEPKLGPVYQQVTHMIPWEFPLLVVVPALAIDLILRRSSAWRPIVGGLVTGLVFLIAFIAVQWPFASFLMTPLARNRFFGTQYMDFGTPAQSLYARTLFYANEVAAVLARDADRGARLVSDDVAGPPRRTRDAEGQTVRTRRFLA